MEMCLLVYSEPGLQRSLLGHSQDHKFSEVA